MTSNAIEVRSLSKHFRVATAPDRSLKEVTFGFLTRRLKYESFVAVDNIDLAIAPGEAVGLIGPNGSGKSTLFKLLSGILRPSAGTLETHGRISPLIELSAGFHPELTGLENIYLNGAIYGMSRAEVTSRLGLIIDFADIGDFIHRPIRTYSSGMMARLAFALAINTDADILLIDEVLAVGDHDFQKKCHKVITELHEGGATIVFVSHNMDDVARLCRRVVLLNNGRVVRDGEPDEVIHHYIGE